MIKIINENGEIYELKNHFIVGELEANKPTVNLFISHASPDPETTIYLLAMAFSAFFDKQKMDKNKFIKVLMATIDRVDDEKLNNKLFPNKKINGELS